MAKSVIHGESSLCNPTKSTNVRINCSHCTTAPLSPTPSLDNTSHTNQTRGGGRHPKDGSDHALPTFLWISKRYLLLPLLLLRNN